MKSLLLLTVLFVAGVSFGQSKKAQIEILTNRVDSLNNLVQIERDDSAKEITELNAIVDGLNTEISELKQSLSEVESSVANLEKDKTKLTSENEKLKADLEEIAKKNLELEAKMKVMYPKVETVKIGKQEWMSKDVNVDKYNNGESILEAKSENEWNLYGQRKIGCFMKFDNGAMIYNGYALEDERGLIPLGFRIPTVDDFHMICQTLDLLDYTDMVGDCSQAMATYVFGFEEWVGDMDTGGLDWKEVQCNGRSGFNAKQGGFVYSNGYKNEGQCSYWWVQKGDPYQDCFFVGFCTQDGTETWNLANGYAVRGIKE